MGEYFQGWRKKVAVVSLVVACVFMAGWVRSLSDTDIVEFYGGTHTTELVYSFDCSVVWIEFQDEQSHDEMSFPEWISTRRTNYVFFDDPKFNWNWQWAGFGVGGCHSEASVLWIIPYWSIVIPLTLISAFLLFSKPRNSTLKKIADPISNEGGATS